MKFTRSSVSIPPELMARMRAAGKMEPINWSAVACQAFEQKLAELASRRQAATIGDAIERLRADRLARESSRYGAGHEHGRAWAIQRANLDELVRLDRQRGGKVEHGADMTWMRDVIQVAVPESEPHRDDLDFVRGFAFGALAVWKEIREQI